MSGIPTTAAAAPTAGAATAAGIWFQATWAVLQLAEAKVTHRNANGDLQLTLEPKGGGGDVILRAGPTRRVVQLKILSRGTWSLKDIVVDVLPDLYRAVDVTEDSVTYEFVTEGRRGDWADVQAFFDTLAQRLAEAKGDVLAAEAVLDTPQSIQFGGSDGPFWQPAGTTRKGLIDRIVAHLRAAGGPASDERADLTRRKVWHLLGRFRFDGGHSRAAVRRRVETALLAIAPLRERVPNLFDELVGKVTERSTANGAVLTRADLFPAVGLADVVRADDRFEIARRCRLAVHGWLGLAEYQPDWDVRRPAGPDADLAVPITVFAGDSGAGKSWAVYARAAAAPTVAVTLAQSAGNAATDLQTAANLVWQSALNHDETLPLVNVADRLATAMGPARGNPWLTACIDQVDDVKVANDLLKVPLQEWGVRLVVGCSPHVAAVFDRHRASHPDRVRVCRVDRFTLTQLHDYLGRRLGDAWADVPSESYDLLCQPLLADVYCQLANVGGPGAVTRPASEFELIDQFWDRLDPSHGMDRFDESRLRVLAGRLIDGGAYPWSNDQARDAELDGSSIGRLVRAGWLRDATSPRGSVEVPHDRLLSYAMARSIVGRCGQGVDAAGVSDAMAAVASGPVGRRVARLTGDWFHLALADDALRPVATELARLAWDGVPWGDRDDLYARVLPSLEDRALPLMWERLAAVAQSSWPWQADPVIAGLATWPAEPLQSTVADLLAGGPPPVQRAVVDLLGRRPVPGLLDAIWRVHCRMEAEPWTFVAGDRSSGRRESPYLYEKSFAALRVAVRVEPAWLVAHIHTATPGDSCVADLAYLVANLDDGGGVWRACKTDLFRIVGDDKRRALATNIGIWRDAAEADRLAAWATADLGNDPDRLGPAAVRAMAQIDPARAVPLLAGLPDHMLYLTRSWALPMLFRSDGDAVRDVLYDRIRSAADPLHAALVYQGSEADVDVRTLDLLLEEMAATLGRHLGQPRDSAVGLFVPLELLVNMGRADLLPVFEGRRGTALEQRLADLLVDVGGPRQNLGDDFLPRGPGIELLLRIGGDGHGRVTRAYLAGDSQYGRLDAVQYAVWSADEATLAAVAAVGTDPVYWDERGTPLVQMEAARALAAHGDLGRLLDVMGFLGPSIPADLDEWLPPDVTVSADVSGRAMEAIRQRDRHRLPGSLLLLGYVRKAGAAAEAMAVLNDGSADHAAMVAAAVYLGRLGVAEAVAPIAAHLTDGRRWAVPALQLIGTGDAVARLLADLGRTWDTRLAVWLVGRPDVSATAVQLIADRAGTATWPDALADLVEAADDRVLTAVMDRLEPQAVSTLR